MKTKKDILCWWQELGKKDMSKDYTDKQSFLDNIERKFCGWNESKNNKGITQIRINNSRWKFPLYLNFDKNEECFNIKGF
ncbi:MAG: hypothetical protein PHD31_02690 [Candidatus Pacebacteria bacterium]|nr:hypothetical protein [Candidatus Paceibacterota bacterium]